VGEYASGSISSSEHMQEGAQVRGSISKSEQKQVGEYASGSISSSEHMQEGA